MSEIVYALRSPSNNRVVIIEVTSPASGFQVGDRVQAQIGSMSFLYQPIFGWAGEEYNRPFEAALSRLEVLWANRMRPKLVALTDSKAGHKIKAGQTVFYWKSKNGHEWECAPFDHYTANETMFEFGRIVEVLPASVA